MLDMLSIQDKASVIPWEQRIEKGFFRGRDSNRERLQLVKMSKKHPDLIDAAITRYFFFRDEMEELGSGEHVSLYDFFKVR